MGRYAYLAIIIILIGTHLLMYNQGKTIQAGIEAKTRQELQAMLSEKAKVIYKEKIKVEVKYRDRVKKIYQAADPTGCLDRTLADVGLYKHATDD